MFPLDNMETVNLRLEEMDGSVPGTEEFPDYPPLLCYNGCVQVFRLNTRIFQLSDETEGDPGVTDGL